MKTIKWKEYAYDWFPQRERGRRVVLVRVDIPRSDNNIREYVPTFLKMNYTQFPFAKKETDVEGTHSTIRRSLHSPPPNSSSSYDHNEVKEEFPSSM